MLKNLTGGAVINYGPSLPDPATAFDGALFFKTTGSDQGLYLFSINQDSNPNSFGDQTLQTWNQAGTSNLYVSKTGDTMSGNLQVNAGIRANQGVPTNDSTTFGYGFGVDGDSGLFATGSGSGSTAVSIFLNSVERLKITASTIQFGGSTVWHANNDGAGSGLDADLLDGQDSTFYLNANNFTGTLPVGRLPFTPVQQGGGNNQLTNKIYIGWASGSRLRLQVDATDFADTWPININGNAATATQASTAGSVSWFSVVGRPTNLSQFTNDIGAGAGPTTIAWTSVTGRPTALSQFTNDIGAGGSGAPAPDALVRTAGVTQTSTDGQARLMFTANGFTNFFSPSDFYFRKTDNTPLVILDAGGNVYATGNVTAYSDRRLKAEIKTITDPLYKIDRLNGVTFARIDNGERGTGLIAQDVKEVLPEAVMEDKDGMLSVAYGNMVGLLVEAVKELSRQVQDLKVEVASLKG